MEKAATSKERLLERVRFALEHSAAARTVRGKVRLQVLFSVPRQARELYPYAHVDAQDASRTARSHSIEAYVEQVFMTATYDDDEKETATAARRSRRMMYALECFLYTLPKQRAAVLYVSKLDTSGWGPTMAPKHVLEQIGQSDASTSASAPLETSTSITRVITEAFVRHFACLDHWAADERLARVEHLSLHILARAQGAYLFPSSNENKTKHILTDGQLIKWWRSVVTSVAERTRESGLDVRPYYVVPGYDRLESHQLLPLPDAQSSWVYGHPYSQHGAGLNEGQSLPPLPLAGPDFFNKTSKSLLRQEHIATLLPHFPDDPKSRFIVELARDSHEHINGATLPTKRRAAATAVALPESQRPSRSGTPSRRSATPSTPPPPPSTRRRAGSRSATSSPSPVKLTSTQRQLMRERGALDRVSADEFWTRMAFRQECCSGNAVGVFVALFTRLAGLINGGGGGGGGSIEMARTVSEGHGSGTGGGGGEAGAGAGTTTGGGRSMPGQPLALPYQLLQDIIFKRLMIDACDWSSMAASVDLTKHWETAIGQALQRKGNLKAALGEEEGEAEMEKDPEQVGKGIVWASVEMKGPTADELREAEERFKKAGGHSPATTALKPTTNVLSVKRKRPPPPTQA